MKTILLTGGSSGIGRAAAIQLSNLGHHVITLGRNKDRLAELQQAYPTIETICADLAKTSDLVRICEQVGDRKLDVLINNAGLALPTGDLLNVSHTDFRYQMSVNVEAPLFLAKQLHTNLHHGRILNLTIYSSFKVNRGLACYGISKAALNMLTQYLKEELSEHHIQVGITLPGLVDTNMQKQHPKGALSEKATAMKKQGELLSPETAARFLSWLTLEASDTQFSKEIVDIYDTRHHQHWLPKDQNLNISQRTLSLIRKTK